MSELSRQNLKRVYRELDEVGVAMSVVGTKRQKLMDLGRLVLPITDALVGTRPEVKRVRDDLVRLTHNMRRARTRSRDASRAVHALAVKLKDAQKLVDIGLGDVPEAFDVGEMSLLNTWGYTEREIKPFLKTLGSVHDVLGKMGLAKKVGEARVILDPVEAEPMRYDLFSDTFISDPTRARNRTRSISNAVGGRLWLKLFEKRDVETWGGQKQAWGAFSDAFYRLVKGKSLKGRDAAKMAVSLGRVIGPENWRRVS